MRFFLWGFFIISTFMLIFLLILGYCLHVIYFPLDVILLMGFLPLGFLHEHFHEHFLLMDVLPHYLHVDWFHDFVFLIQILGFQINVVYVHHVPSYVQDAPYYVPYVLGYVHVLVSVMDVFCLIFVH